MSGGNWHRTELAHYNIKEPFNPLLLILKVRHLAVSKVSGFNFDWGLEWGRS